MVLFVHSSLHYSNVQMLITLYDWLQEGSVNNYFYQTSISAPHFNGADLNSSFKEICNNYQLINENPMKLMNTVNVSGKIVRYNT